MSKIGNTRVGMQESDDYRFGWESAERGEPFPQWESGLPFNTSLTEQRIGWQDYHDQGMQP
jgi:hypothetical protein